MICSSRPEKTQQDDMTIAVQWIPRASRILYIIGGGIAAAAFVVLTDLVALRVYSDSPNAAGFVLLCGLYGLVEIFNYLWNREIRDGLLMYTAWMLLLLFIVLNYYLGGRRNGYCGILKQERLHRKFEIGPQHAPIIYEVVIRN